jgi:hypothetical protein
LIISGPFKNLIQKHPINIELELGGKNKRLKKFLWRIDFIAAAVVAMAILKQRCQSGK